MPLILIVLGATIILISFSVRYVPYNPPHAALVTLFGRRTRMVKLEGYRFFPGYPFVFGAYLVPVQDRVLKIQLENVISEDWGKFQNCELSLTWKPDAGHLFEFVGAGDFHTVEANLRNILEEGLRSWAKSEGSKWSDLQKQGFRNLRNFLIQNISGQDHGLTGGGSECDVQIKSLGARIVRLSILNIDPSPELIDLKIAKAREISQREAEEVQNDHVINLIERLQKRLHCTHKQASDIVQTERGKIPKQIYDVIPESLVDAITKKFLS